ncbi:uncharacterized protein PpBr36_11064 [Pyricularia pennisetigena]|nr:uncharacterized protein PpBr36_11064 [Pyricularia pennisetigena]TLS20635.1 hypothetical protein PpBr36_11064 [Pyricularia pennisetigena]
MYKLLAVFRALQTWMDKDLRKFFEQVFGLANTCVGSY